MANRDSARFLARGLILLFGNDSTRFLSGISFSQSGDVEERFFLFSFPIDVFFLSIYRIWYGKRITNRVCNPLLWLVSLSADLQRIRSFVRLTFWPRTNRVDTVADPNA